VKMDTDYPGGQIEIANDMFAFMIKHFGMP